MVYIFNSYNYNSSHFLGHLCAHAPLFSPHHLRTPQIESSLFKNSWFSQSFVAWNKLKPLVTLDSIIIDKIIKSDKYERFVQKTSIGPIIYVTMINSITHYSTPWLRYVRSCIIWKHLSFSSWFPHLWGALMMCIMTILTR